MTKHTPGPWRFRFYAGDDELIELMRQQGQKPVRMLTNEGQIAVTSGDENFPSRIALVDCQTDFKRGKGGETDCEERDANARLIAKAPEMYDLLRRIQGAAYWRTDDNGLSPALDKLLMQIDGHKP